MPYVIWVLVLVQYITTYKEIMHDIALAEIEEIDVTIKLANRDTISQVGIVRDVEVLCGKFKKPVIATDETIIYNVDIVVPTAYIEKPPFPVG